MQKKTTILGIETSCDETAVALIRENNMESSDTIQCNLKSSWHYKEFGGVVPELAARAHAEKIDLLAKKAIYESGVEQMKFLQLWSRQVQDYYLFDCWFKFGAMASSLNLHLLE